MELGHGVSLRLKYVSIVPHDSREWSARGHR
jgi:hypothetical protein